MNAPARRRSLASPGCPPVGRHAAASGESGKIQWSAVGQAIAEQGTACHRRLSTGRRCGAVVRPAGDSGGSGGNSRIGYLTLLFAAKKCERGSQALFQ
jgi:hypothetical protein